MNRFIFLSLLCLATPFFAGCESVSVFHPEYMPYQPPAQVPERIYVENFLTPPNVFHVDRDDEELKRFQEDMVDEFARQLVVRLDKKVAPAERIPHGASLPPGSYWLVAGRMNRVEQGSRALRMLIGLGAGGTKVETTVIVYDLSHGKKQPFLRFQTTGGSNAMPGAFASTTILGAGTVALLNAQAGLSTDSRRTAREITAMLSDYLHQRGVIQKEKVLKPKRLGRWL